MTTTTFIPGNDVNTTLAAAASSSATTLTLASSANLPSLSGGQQMPLTLNDAATGAVYEIVYVTAISGATLTIVRGQEGTTARNWNIGDFAFCAPTSGTVAQVNGNPANQFQVAAATASDQAPQFGQVNSGRLLNVQVFTASGTYTPTTGTSSILVEAVGGGGGSGGVSAQTSGFVGLSTPGASGSYAKARFTTGFSGVTVTVGAAGTAGAAGANAGGAGGSTSFGSLISCPGGTAGQGGSGASTFQLIITTAQPAAPTITGTAQILVSTAGQGGTYGVNQASGGGGAGGVGGSNPLGTGGLGGIGGGSPAQGKAGSGYGAGAGATYVSPSGAATAGNVGTQGIVIVYEYS